VQRERAERAEEWLMSQERDYRSLTVQEYDPHQEAEKLRHRQMLKDIINVKY
jgi:hypothetical protein